MNFQPVRATDNWGAIETYVVGAEPNAKIYIDRPCRLTVRWPDGTEEEAVVYVRTVSGAVVNDHGHPYQGSSKRPFILVDVHGASVKLPLHHVAAVDIDSIRWVTGATAARNDLPDDRWVITGKEPIPLTKGGDP